MIHKIIVLQGIPGSGKTFYAKNWVNEDPTHRVRFNRDDIRNMCGKYWVPEREEFINQVYKGFLDDAMLAGYDVVIDNMNLNHKTITEIIDIVEDFNNWIKGSELSDIQYEIEYKKFFDTPLEECIKRDSKRENPITASVIRDIYEKYKPQYNFE